MHKFLRRAILSATFTSLAVLAGCTGKKSAPPMPGLEQRTHATGEVALKAGQIFTASGENIKGIGNCDLDDSRMTTFHCSYSTENAATGVEHDWLVYENGATSLQRCGYNPGNPAKAATDSATHRHFLEDANEKFRQLGFAVQGTFAAPEETQFQSGQACLRETRADFLLKSGGRFYAAKFHEVLDETGANPSYQQVEDLKPVDALAARAPKR